MKKVVLLICSIFLLCGCNNVKDNKKLDDDVIIVDVRTFEEYSEGHIKGAINIPYDTIDENVELSKDSKIKVYFKSGKRSKIAYDTLKKLGYDVEDLGAYANIDLPKE